MDTHKKKNDINATLLVECGSNLLWLHIEKRNKETSSQGADASVYI